MTRLTCIKTPCIGVCSTGLGDTVCRGCKRFAGEVIDWNRFSSEEKLAVFRRLESLLAQVVDDRVQVVDTEQLRQAMHHQKIRLNAYHDPRCWVFDLLKAGASQIDDLTEFGCRIRPRWQGTTLSDLRDMIDADFYALSCAHYERYFRN